MIHYYFPPLGGIGSVRAAAMAAALPEFGWRPTVVAPARGSYHADPSLGTGDVEVVRAYAPDPSFTGKRVLYGEGVSAIQPAQVGRVGLWIRDAVRRWVYRPDAQVGWYPFARARARALLRDHRFDVVFSSSFPVTAHLVARTVARESQVPWVAEFRDPWSAAMAAGDPRRAFAEQCEGRLLAEAAAVVTVSPTWAREWAARGARRTAVVTNGFDPEPLAEPATDAARERRFVISHVGTFYPEMADLSSIWKAVARLRNELGGDGLRIRFVGECPPPLKTELEKEGVSDLVDITGFVPHDRARAMMRESSVLVVGGPSRPGTILEGWIPAKIFEYLSSGRPILYVGTRDGDAARLIGGQEGCWVIPAADAPAAYDALKEIRRAGSFSRHLSEYSRRELAGKLASLLADVSRR